MPTYKSSVSVEASPEDAFAYVSEVRNLPSYLPAVRSAEPTGFETVRLTAVVAGETRVSDAWFRVDEGRRHRIEWGAGEAAGEPGAYYGWLEVDREGDVVSVTAEVHLEQGRDDIDAVLDAALFALKAAIESA